MAKIHVSCCQSSMSQHAQAEAMLRSTPKRHYLTMTYNVSGWQVSWLRYLCSLWSPFMETPPRNGFTA